MEQKSSLGSFEVVPLVSISTSCEIKEVGLCCQLKENDYGFDKKV